MEQREYTQEELMIMVANMPEDMILTIDLGVDEDETI